MPRVVVDGVTCDDLETGEIKNSWFITACTALANMPAMWNKVNRCVCVMSFLNILIDAVIYYTSCQL